MRQRNRRSSRRRGLTLIELLVVGTIIIAVTAVSLPVVKPMLESQMTKNGAQMVATALNRARNRAQVTGRSCGLCFEFWPGTSEYLEFPSSNKTEDGYDLLRHYKIPGASLVIRQVEVPPPYSGLLGVETVSYGGGQCLFKDDIYAPKALEASAGAKIQIGGNGPYYSFRANSTRLKESAGAALPPERETAYPFKILLKPRTTMAMPTLLPQGTAVDLQFSGIGDSLFLDMKEILTDEITPEQVSLTIMFSADGSVESINGVMPSEPVHFLIGRWDQISAVRTDGDTESYPNYADGRNYWVTVSPLTGTVTINPVNPTADVGYDPDYYTNEYGDTILDPRLQDGVISISRELTK